jgi:hypothetical protein
MTIDLIIASATDHANKARAANHAAMQALAGNHGPGAQEAIDHNCAAAMHWEAVLNSLHKLRRDMDLRGVTRWPLPEEINA